MISDCVRAAVICVREPATDLHNAVYEGPCVFFVTLGAQDQTADHYGAVCKFAVSSGAGGREPVCTCVCVCVCVLIQLQACAVLTDEDDLF